MQAVTDRLPVYACAAALSLELRLRSPWLMHKQKGRGAAALAAAGGALLTAVPHSRAAVPLVLVIK
jgi:hypothetical protein